MKTSQIKNLMLKTVKMKMKYDTMQNNQQTD